MLGEDGLKFVTQLIGNVYWTGEWPLDFTEFKTIALKKEPKAAKCSDHHTLYLIALNSKDRRGDIWKKVWEENRGYSWRRSVWI